MIRLIVFLILIFFLHASAWATEYCVRDVELPYATKTTLFGRDSNIVFPDNEVILPQSVTLYDGTTFPFVSEMISVPTKRKGQLEQTGLLLWTVNEFDREFLGPFPFYWRIRTRSAAVNSTDNSIAFIGGRYTSDNNGTHAYGTDKTWQTRIFTYNFKSPPKPLEANLEQELKWPRSVFWSDILGGYLISSVKEKKFASVISRTYLLKNLEPQTLKLEGASFLKDLPELNMVAVLDFSKLYFLDSRGNIVLSRPINSGDDYNGWEGIYLLTDNWLYMDGFKITFRFVRELVVGTALCHGLTIYPFT
jgi:hypothetical protein